MHYTVKCPYCGKNNEIEFFESGYYDGECQYCDNKFEVDFEVIIDVCKIITKNCPICKEKYEEPEKNISDMCDSCWNKKFKK